jgi:hypothetical protein
MQNYMQGEEEMNTMPFEKCPVCGGDLVEKEVEKVLRGGVNTAVLRSASRSAFAVERDYTRRKT